MNASTSLIAVQGHIEEAGAIVWWRLEGGLNHADLTEAWKSAGLNEDLLPNTSTLDDCLRRAVTTHQRKRYRARPTEVGWALVEEVVTEGRDDLTFRTDLKLRIEGEQVVCEPAAHPLASQIAAEFGYLRSELSAVACGSWLVSLVRSLQAVPLRDGGGVYFIPRHHLDAWRTMLGVVRKVSAHVVSEVRALRSEEALAAITDAINRDAEAHFEKVSEEIQKHMTGEVTLGERAVETRQQRLRELSTKLETYEQLLGTRLETLRGRMEQIVGALALGHLATAGSFQ